MLDADVRAFYEKGWERDRLKDPRRSIEYLRTLDILERFLPLTSAVLDVGGGPGTYALALAAAGHAVTLLDPVALHVDQAREASKEAPVQLAHIGQGDARALPYPGRSFDAVLLLGPLYHLVDDDDRHKAWREAHRVLRPGGIVVAAAISRYYSTWEMLSKNKLDLPGAEESVQEHLRSGQHRNPTDDYEQLFTTAYFHDPMELAEEARLADLQPCALLAVEGPTKLLPDLADRLQDPARADQVLRALRRLEDEPTVLGTSEHVIVVAVRRAGR